MPPWGGELLIDILPHLDFARLAAAAPDVVRGVLGPLHVHAAVHPADGRRHGPRQLPAGGPHRPSGAVACLVGRRGAARARRGLHAARRRPLSGARRGLGRDPAGHQLRPHRCRGLEGARARERPETTVSPPRGRLIGGTLDVIGVLPGTRYGDLEAFVERQAPEGLLFYLDDCDFNPAQYCRMLHHLRLAGWFRHANAVLVGRTAAEDLRESHAPGRPGGRAGRPGRPGRLRRGRRPPAAAADPGERRTGDADRLRDLGFAVATPGLIGATASSLPTSAQSCGTTGLRSPAAGRSAGDIRSTPQHARFCGSLLT